MQWRLGKKQVKGNAGKMASRIYKYLSLFQPSSLESAFRICNRVMDALWKTGTKQFYSLILISLLLFFSFASFLFTSFLALLDFLLYLLSLFLVFASRNYFPLYIYSSLRYFFFCQTILFFFTTFPCDSISFFLISTFLGCGRWVSVLAFRWFRHLFSPTLNTFCSLSSFLSCLLYLHFRPKSLFILLSSRNRKTCKAPAIEQ